MANSTCKILIVEDNAEIRATLKLALELEGFGVSEAADGIDAMTILDNEPHPDLIILDMLMPRMNGWEFIATVKKNSESAVAKIPIIVVTATSERVQHTPGEIQGVMKKPIDLNELYSTVSRFSKHKHRELEGGT